MIRAFVMLALVALSGCPKTASVPSEPAPVAAAKIDQAPIAPAAGDATAKATDGQATDAQPTDAKAASASDKASGPPPEPTLLDMMGADCRKQGGTFEKAPSGGYACFHTPKDAGKHCLKASDCSTLCLARSQTCAPIAPLFGCNDIFGGNGEIQKYCSE
jgi:hypothetical protein